MKTSIVTFNIRYIYNNGDGINDFIHRAGLIFDKVEAEKPDVIALQEMTEKILNLFERLFPEYLLVGHFKNADYTGGGMYIAVRKGKYQLLGCETRWLSPTPFVAGSRFENQSPSPRTCVMALLRHLETGKIFRIFNIHLDHISDEARILGIKSAYEFIDEMNSKLDLPYILLGDFNARPESETIKFCNSRPNIKDITSHIPATLHKFGKKEEDVKIDYIYVTDEFAEKVTDVKIWDDKKDGIYLSDHYPICAELDI